MADSGVASQSVVMADISDVCIPVSDEDWHARRALIQRLYLENDLTLKELIHCMKRDHGFRAT
jgi:hypothetical protein